MTNNQTLFFCIGAQKSATTWLHLELNKSPDVFLAPPKEINYWNVVRSPFMGEYRLLTRRRLTPRRDNSWKGIVKRTIDGSFFSEWRERELLIQRYNSIFESDPRIHQSYLEYIGIGENNNRLCGDVSPYYALLSSRTYREMSECHPDTKFIYIIRDPVDRLWSGVAQRFRHNFAAGQFKDIDHERLFREALEDYFHLDFQLSNYKRTIQNLRTAVPFDNIVILFFETLIDPNVVDEREKLQKFLNIPSIDLDVSRVAYWGTSDSKISSELRGLARERLQFVYDFVGDAVSADLPARWST